uniref:Transposase n=1 Tax=Candidatus Kentrum sp. TC TaxID=2126339 RepID=A0A450YKA1_9GAMM|nr:MAG: Transposase [Candidatus Kentron sp. TC]
MESLECGRVRQVDTFSLSKEKLYEEFQALCAGAVTLRDDTECNNPLPGPLGVSWDTIKDIQARYLHQRFDKPKLSKPERIAIDEIRLGTSSGYLTIVMDLDSGALVEVADGRSTKVLAPFWKRLKHSRAKLEAVATDMGTAYIEAVRENLPGAVLVFDHFHIIKIYNEKLANLRREIEREADVLEKNT